MWKNFDFTNIKTTSLEEEFRYYINEETAKKMAEEMSVIVSHLIEHENSKETKTLYDIYDCCDQILEILPKKCIYHCNWDGLGHLNINTLLEDDKEFRCAYDIIKKKSEELSYKDEYFFHKLRLICNYLIDIYKISYIRALEGLKDACDRTHQDMDDLFNDGNAFYANEEYIYTVIIVRLHFFIQELNEIIINFCSRYGYFHTSIDDNNGLLYIGVEIPKFINNITRIETIYPSPTTNQPEQPTIKQEPNQETTQETIQDYTLNGDFIDNRNSFNNIFNNCQAKGYLSIDSKTNKLKIELGKKGQKLFAYLCFALTKGKVFKQYIDKNGNTGVCWAEISKDFYTDDFDMDGLTKALSTLKKQKGLKEKEKIDEILRANNIQTDYLDEFSNKEK